MRTAVNLHTNCKMYKPEQPLCHIIKITAQAGSFSMQHVTTLTPCYSNNIYIHITTNLILKFLPTVDPTAGTLQNFLHAEGNSYTIIIP
jgi:hypothetical protein